MDGQLEWQAGQLWREQKQAEGFNTAEAWHSMLASWIGTLCLLRCLSTLAVGCFASMRWVEQCSIPAKRSSAGRQMEPKPLPGKQVQGQ